MILGGPKDTITSLWTKGLKALVPPNSFGPPPMGGVGVDFKDRALTFVHLGESVCPMSRDTHKCLSLNMLRAWVSTFLIYLHSVQLDLV